MDREEAIRRIRAWNLDADDLEVLGAVIPELRESEDERIRKALVEVAREVAQERFFINRGTTLKDVLAYLEKQKEEEGYEAIPVKSTLEYKLGFADGRDCEKQKEQKPGEDIFNDPRYLEGFDTGREVQRIFDEQKPVEYLDKDKVYAIMKKLTSLSFCVPLGSDEEKRIHEITCDVRSLLDYLIEHKPAEWDDYTKMNLGRAIQIIKDARGNLYGYQTDDGIYECDKAIEALEHFLYRGLEIEKPAEWSEEDELTIADLINYFEGDSLECSTEEMVQRIKSLRPSWKPSEEQMDALESAQLMYAHGFERGDIAGVLESLYNDLKKL